jgi:hypothetical protein
MRASLSLVFFAVWALGCNRHTLEKALMLSAYHADLPSKQAGPSPYQLLAGDMHCHVTPPDAPSDVNRTVADTIALARDEHLDFVVFTPHLAGRFFIDPEERAAAAAGQAELLRTLETLGARHAEATAGETLFIRGFEYTDHRYGHVSASFADLGKVLDEVPLEVARTDPARFFERWVADGGLLSVNHPVVTPLRSSISIARADLSWRPWTSTAPVPPEISAVHRLAFGFEAYNLVATHLRDAFLLHDEEHSIREVLRRIDGEILAKRRRLAPVGGSDSHTGFLRAAVFVLAERRTEASIREALVRGRTCVRSPEACSLEVRAPGGAWASVGGVVQGDREVEVRAQGGAVTVYRDGTEVASPAPGVTAHVPVVAGQCSVVRARVGNGYSAPVYVNCDFTAPNAEPRP